MEINHVLKKEIKTVDNDITIVKLIETNSSLQNQFIYTVEIVQGLFITEMQYGFNKSKAAEMFSVLSDSELDIYVDKVSVKQIECHCCGAKNVMLITFDNELQLCENCAAQYGLDS